MTDQVFVSVPVPKVNEGSAFTATAYFRDRATAAASVPSTAKYKITCLTTCQTLQDWTSLTPAASNAIAVTATHNAIQNQCNPRERKQLIVASDPDAADQFRATAEWQVENLWRVP